MIDMREMFVRIFRLPHLVLGHAIGRAVGFAVMKWIERDGIEHVLHVCNKQAPVDGCTACDRLIAEGRLSRAS